MGEILVGGFRVQSFHARLSVMLADIIGHFCKRGPGEENAVHTFALHCCGVLMRDRSSAAAKDFDVVGATFPQKSNDFREEFDMATVVA